MKIKNKAPERSSRTEGGVKLKTIILTESKLIQDLQQARVVSSITQQEMADILGYKCSTIAVWETQKDRHLRLRHFIDYCKALGLKEVTIKFDSNE